MILAFGNRLVSKKIYTTLVLLLCVLFPLGSVVAQQSLALSVTPTLFEMSAVPGQQWNSSVKVVNSNTFPITVYAQVVNFAPQGESGQGKLLPVFESMTDGSTLAEWVTIVSDPLEIQPEKSKEVQFSIRVPEDASPGGHFAAIMISTRPPTPEGGARLAVSTTQAVTSLFFVRVAGDVIESGTIRSFTTKKQFSQVPKASFELRFENKGNVHLQPRGEIAIYNMWGTERGTIPINHQTHFGNVLPESIRKFEFSWTGEQSFSDFGRYKAIASLGYGVDSRQFSTSTTYFWVVPVKPLLITLGIIVSFGLFVSWAIKLYVRRMLQLAGVDTRAEGRTRRPVVAEERDVNLRSYRSVSAPMRSGVADLRQRWSAGSAFLDRLRAVGSFVSAYKIFFVSVIAIGLMGSAAYYFISDVFTADKSYEVTIDNPGQSLNLNAEEISYNAAALSATLPQLNEQGEQIFTIDIVNTSGEAGTAAEAAITFAQAGYLIRDLSASEKRIDKTSVVVFDTVVQDEALRLGQLIGGALPSARTGSSTEELPNITFFVGTDQLD